MLSVAYSEAAVEVLDILDHMSLSDLNKIPIKFIEFLEDNASKDYVAHLDYSKQLFEMDLREETKGILGVIYKEYWCSKEERKQYMKTIRENEINFQNELSEKYKVEDLFKKDEPEEQVLSDLERENGLMVRKNGLAALFDKILSFFSRK